MMNFAPALAAAHSARFQSCGTEIGLARAGYAVAVSPLSLLHSTSMPGASRHQDPGLGSMGMGVVGSGGNTKRRPCRQLDGGRSQSADWNRPDSRLAKAAFIWGTN